MSRTDQERLHDALLHFELALSYGASNPLDQKAIDATCLRIAAGIDSLHGLSSALRHELFGDTWHLMWGMRNRIAHTYAQVEATVVVATVRNDLPYICTRIEEHRK